MRWLALGLLCGCTHGVRVEPAPPTEWTTISHGADVSVAVEHVLYEQPGKAHFFVHVRITNARVDAIDADLRTYFGAFYPNQWGASRLDHREVIDERRMMVPKFDASFARECLTRIAPGAFDYYTEFNASSRAEVERASLEDPFIIIAMDGQLKLADAFHAMRLTPNEQQREVPLRVPVAWKTIPATAKILAD